MREYKRASNDRLRAEALAHGFYGEQDPAYQVWRRVSEAKDFSVQPGTPWRSPRIVAEMTKAEWAKLKSQAEYRNRVAKGKVHRNAPLVQMFYSARYRAQQKGLPFDLEPQDIVIPEKCPVFGIPLTFGEGKRHGGSPTVDRVDNAKGYTKDNIQVISYRANVLKSDATLAEMKAIVSYMSALEN